jgi:hypothetical protein
MKSKSLILCLVLILISLTVISQESSDSESDKSVFITVSGSGKTKDEAKQSAFRSAIEQAYGAFISSKTEIFNDQLVADQMSSVSSGNIKSFEVLNESQLPDGSWGVTLKSIVSVSKLTSFVEAKGFTVEIKGGMFALNIKQQLLNEQGEMQAVANMVGLLHEPMQTAFDYSIKSGDPKSIDAESKNWEIPLVVTATANKNLDICANYCNKTLSALSLTSSEVETYKSLNKQVFPVSISYNGNILHLYLRKQTSINVLLTLIRSWEGYLRSFVVNSGMGENIGIGKGDIYKFSENKYYFSDSYYGTMNSFNAKISFPSAGERVATFSWNDKRTLPQIEQMTGYTVKPRGVKSQFKHGGFVVHEENGHGIVAAVYDLGFLIWNEATSKCNELIINGYNDWYLPSKNNLEMAHKNLFNFGFGGFDKNYYWSSTPGRYDEGEKHNFNSIYDNSYRSRPNLIRAFRSF